LTRFHRLAGALGVTLLLAFGLSASAQPPSQAPKMSCFQINDWSGWKLTPDAKSMYIRVNVSRIYRLDFGAACNAAGFGNPHLITKTRGSASICSPLDLDLQVSQGRGMSVGCIVSNISQLSSEEAAALPRSLRP
jgi:hypothetical protein